jgi:hypothetical protein
MTVLSFVSGTLGWAIGGTGLLGTTDGGRTWTVLAAAPRTAAPLAHGANKRRTGTASAQALQELLAA